MNSAFNGKNKALADRIKDKINLLDNPNAEQLVLIKDFETVGLRYTTTTDYETEIINNELLKGMTNLLESFEQIASCIAKHQAAGLYSSFYETITGRDFCDNSQLDMFSRSISSVELSLDSASLLGIKSAAGASFAVTMGRIFKKAAPVFSRVFQLKQVTKMISLIYDLMGANISKLGVNGAFLIRRG